MIEKLKPYEKYQATSVPWALRVPAHWTARRGKSVLVESRLPTADGQEVVTCFRDGQVTLRRNRRTSGFMVALYEQGYQGVRKGQLVVHAMDAFAGAIGISDSDGKCTPEYVVCNARNSSVSLRYVAQALRVAARHGFILASCPSVRERAPRFRWANLGDLILPLPPLDEQLAIVRFLDHANRRIDQFIRSKKKLIALLNEQKQGIIHRAVTRGLDANIKLKNSGVPWLGQVPAHWEVTRVKGEFDCLNNRRVPLNAPERGRMKRREFDYYGASGVIDKVDAFIFDDELLLLAEDGANLVLRNLPLAIVARGRFWVNNHAHVLKPRRGRLEYLANYMETLNYRPWITGAAQPKLTKDRLMSIAICVAPPTDQRKIDTHVSAATAPLRIALTTADREVVLAREYRTRLISDIVTGQLDVRTVAAGLPVIEPEAALTESEGDETDIDDGEAA